MASVDVTPYVDLTLYDLDPQEVVDTARLDLGSKLPELVLREGLIEAVLIEALALEAAEVAYVINRLPAAVIEGVFRLYGITRDAGAPPSTTLRVTVADAAGYTFPAGLRARLDLGVAGDPVVFTTTAGITIAPGQTFGTAPAIGDRNTDDANGVAAGTVVELLDAFVSVQTVTTEAVIGNGREEETSDAWRTRGVARLSRLSDVLSVPRHFTAAASERPEVTRATTLDNTNNGGTVGAAPGYVTVAVYGTGAVLSAAQREAIRVDLDDRAQANLSVAVIDPTITAVPVTATVVRKAGYDDATVKANITAALAAYLAPASWPWAGTVYRNELIAIIDGAAGVERVTTLTSPAADTALAGVAPLASLGAVALTTT
jgi:uncharacterized phage protein gp47/JayE